MPILDKLLIKRLRTADNICTNSLFLKAQVEAMAVLGHQFIFLVDQQEQTFVSFNYNPDLHSLFGSNPHVIKFENILKLMDSSEQTLLCKYIKLINNYFTNKSSSSDKNIFFTIEHSLDVYKSPEGARIKILPFQFDYQNNLLATLAIIEPIHYAGCAILTKHSITKNNIEIYNISTKRFTPKESVLLTDIECQILHLSGIGIKEKNIAKKLDITLPRLKRIKTIVFDKLKVNSISEAIFVAYKRKYINTDLDI